MRAQIKKFHSPDILDLENFVPKDPERFAFLLQVFIGPEGQDGQESFDIEVCTPKWLIQNYTDDTVIIGRHYLIVFKYDFKRITETIKAFCKNCTGETWAEVAIKLSRLGMWEFEDYREKE